MPNSHPGPPDANFTVCVEISNHLLIGRQLRRGQKKRNCNGYCTVGVVPVDALHAHFPGPTRDATGLPAHQPSMATLASIHNTSPESRPRGDPTCPEGEPGLNKLAFPRRPASASGVRPASEVKRPAARPVYSFLRSSACWVGYPDKMIAAPLRARRSF